MTSRHIRTPGRRLAGIAATIALAAASVLVLASPAIAHEELVSSDPAAGATVAASPTQITLTFTGPVLADLGGNLVQVTDAAGAVLSDGEPVVQDNLVTQPLAGDAAGAIAVSWRVVSEDGHPISGEFSFTVTPTPTPTPTPFASAPSTPTPTEPGTPSPSATPAAAASVASPVPWIVLGAVLIAAAAAVVYLLVSRGRRPPAPPAALAPER